MGCAGSMRTAPEPSDGFIVRGSSERKVATSLAVFHEMALKLLPQDESLKAMLSKPSGRQVFRLFLEQQGAQEASEAMKFVEEMESLEYHAVTAEVRGQGSEVLNEGTVIFEQFVFSKTFSQMDISSSLRDDISAILNGGPGGDGGVESLASASNRLDDGRRLLDVVNRTKGDIFRLMALGVFRQFIQSTLYKQWQSEEASKTLQDREDSLRASSRVTDDTSPASSIRHQYGSLTSGSWLTHFIKATDSLPVSVCVATARKDRLGFPLVYVNKMFTETTGFSCDDALNRNCNFLQSPETIEQDQKYLIRKALGDAQPVRLIVTNHKKSGEKFFNLISIKPIFDQHGEYRFAVSMQFEVRRANGMRLFNFANQLLDMLPSIVYCTPDE
jgi:PAS domain S-box-containing protein